MLSGVRSTWHIRARTRGAHTLRRWNNTYRRCYASQVDYWEEAAAASGEDDHQISGSASSDNGVKDPRNGTLVGIVAARIPKETSLDTLLEQIVPRPPTSPSNPNSFPSVLITLLTPTYAQHAESEELPLKILERFANNPTISKPLDAVTAVVDRLPVPNGAKSGEEGLAYAFLANHAPLDTSSRTPFQPDAQKPGSLTFRISTFSNLPGLMTIQMPLASTVFSTGKPSTLVHTRYQYDPVAGHLKKSATAQLETQAVTLPIAAAGRVKYFDFQAPLAPLTPMREVSNCYGNIVQKLKINRAGQAESESSTDGSESHIDSHVPASQELERAVSEYFQAVGIDPQPVEVWALITPSLAHLPFHSHKKKMGELAALQSDSVKAFWRDSTIPDPDLIRDSIAAYLRHGARLAKVLSGGGGWGKKAGLLSLDPDTTYSTRHLRSEQGWDIDLDDENAITSIGGRDKGSFSEVVSSGEGIMFFIALKDQDIKPSSRRQLQQTEAKVTTLGSIPSSVDDIFEDQKVGIPKTFDSGNICEHFPDTFGMLSEGGMAIQQIRHSGTTYSKTKADVPFATMTIGRSHNHIDPEFGWSYGKTYGEKHGKPPTSYRTQGARTILKKLEQIERFDEQHLPEDFDAEIVRQPVQQYLDFVQLINPSHMYDMEMLHAQRTSVSKSAARETTLTSPKSEDETSPLVAILDADTDLNDIHGTLYRLAGSIKSRSAIDQPSQQAVSKEELTDLKEATTQSSQPDVSKEESISLKQAMTQSFKTAVSKKKTTEQKQKVDQKTIPGQRRTTGQLEVTEEPEYADQRVPTPKGTRQPRRRNHKAKRIEVRPEDAVPPADGRGTQGNHALRKIQGNFFIRKQPAPDKHFDLIRMTVIKSQP